MICSWWGVCIRACTRVSACLVFWTTVSSTRVKQSSELEERIKKSCVLSWEESQENSVKKHTNWISNALQFKHTPALHILIPCSLALSFTSFHPYLLSTPLLFSLGSLSLFRFRFPEQNQNHGFCALSSHVRNFIRCLGHATYRTVYNMKKRCKSKHCTYGLKQAAQKKKRGVTIRTRRGSRSI